MVGIIIDGISYENLGYNSAPAIVVSGVAREELAKPITPGPKATIDGLAVELLVDYTLSGQFIPVFPILPWDFPLKMRPTMKTTIGSSTADREIRLNQQSVPLWEFELTFPELRDQTQNTAVYAPFAGYTQFMQLVQNWLGMYGSGGIFAFSVPWDNARTMQAVGTGDGSTYVFTLYKNWGIAPASITETVGMVNIMSAVYVNSTLVSPANYYVDRNKIVFRSTDGTFHIPASGATISATFSFYYLCRFMDNALGTSEFMKNRYEVQTLKFRSILWP